MWLCVGIEITPAKEIPNESAMVAAAKLNSLNSASIYNQTRNKSIKQNSTFFYETFTSWHLKVCH